MKKVPTAVEKKKEDHKETKAKVDPKPKASLPKSTEVKAESTTKPKQALAQPVKKAAVIEKKKVDEPVQKQIKTKITAAKSPTAKVTPAKGTSA